MNVQDIMMTVKGLNLKHRVICFIESNSSKYVIYTLNEVDENDNITIYISKIVVTENGLDGITIRDENEWNIIKGYIKEIFTTNKISVKTLDYSSLLNIDMSDYRKIKIPRKSTLLVLKEFTPLLFKNKENIVKPESNENIVKPKNNKNDKIENSYKELYLKEKQENEKLIQKINQLTSELNGYKLAFSNVKNAIKNVD